MKGNLFKSNLKATFKFVLMVWAPLSIFIIIDSIREGTDNYLLPLFLIGLAPVIVLAVYVYTKLKDTDLNKYLSALLFSIIVTFAAVLFSILGNIIESKPIDLDYLKRLSILGVIINWILYVQLPWQSTDNNKGE